MVICGRLNFLIDVYLIKLDLLSVRSVGVLRGWWKWFLLKKSEIPQCYKKADIIKSVLKENLLNLDLIYSPARNFDSFHIQCVASKSIVTKLMHEIPFLDSEISL